MLKPVRWTLGNTQSRLPSCRQMSHASQKLHTLATYSSSGEAKRALRLNSAVINPAALRCLLYVFRDTTMPRSNPYAAGVRAARTKAMKVRMSRCLAPRETLVPKLASQSYILG